MELMADEWVLVHKGKLRKVLQDLDQLFDCVRGDGGCPNREEMSKISERGKEIAAMLSAAAPFSGVLYQYNLEPDAGVANFLAPSNPAPRCEWCDPSFGCFNGSKPCQKVPASAAPDSGEGIAECPRCFHRFHHALSLREKREGWMLYPTKEMIAAGNKAAEQWCQTIAHEPKVVVVFRAMLAALREEGKI